MSCKGNRTRHRWIRAKTDEFNHRVGTDKPKPDDWCLRCHQTRKEITKQKVAFVAVEKQ